MNEEIPKNYTINFTSEDKIKACTNAIVEWWVDQAHPEIRVRAEKLAKEMIEKQVAKSTE